MKIDLGEDFTHDLNTIYKNMSLSEAIAKAAFIDLESQITRLTVENQQMRVAEAMAENRKSTEEYLKNRLI